MRIARPKLRKRRGDQGFGLIELLIAMIVLVVGMMGGMIIVIVAINSNTRSKNDTTATALAQSVMEKILAVPTGTKASMLDCVQSSSGGAPVDILTAIGGAPTLTSVGALPTYVGAIDFSKAQVKGYSMYYQVCGSGGSVSTYDVRWNVSAGPTANTSVITVAARNTVMRNNPVTGQPAATGPLFLFPITLRTLKGN